MDHRNKMADSAGAARGVAVSINQIIILEMEFSRQQIPKVIS